MEQLEHVVARLAWLSTSNVLSSLSSTRISSLRSSLTRPISWWVLTARPTSLSTACWGRTSAPPPGVFSVAATPPPPGRRRTVTPTTVARPPSWPGRRGWTGTTPVWAASAGGARSWWPPMGMGVALGGGATIWRRRRLHWSTGIEGEVEIIR